MTHRDESSASSPRDERFRVHPARLREAATEFGGLGDDATEAMSYASRWVDFDPSGGAVFERFVDVTTGMDTGVRDLMADIERAMSGTAAALLASAERYESLDAAAAQRLDTSYWGH
ncbi:ESX-1 secretion-associated protein [Phycicoccus sp. MAQZ13P-2]|uniref:type VII secretion target n=1 Tax=Phycicoccus mangrovi TaxID=2840470 RepID=UPI001C004370|nr:type VII secretion target [Phycicoccus mangrovi]MBT9256551.1 ESX-1 secretion-associated protein [Phycicoccus mangrovi]MBT9275199.1 ESX-1 secretion-associated protein [Phycicoccus mangrovi]